MSIILVMCIIIRILKHYLVYYNIRVDKASLIFLQSFDNNSLHTIYGDIGYYFR